MVEGYYVSFEENAKYLKTGESQGKALIMKIGFNSCLEGSIYEQFAYLPNLVIYPNSAGMNELSEIALERFEV